MSEHSRGLPRRSVLVVPGSSDRFVAKAPTVPADMVLLDLEDAVAPDAKVEARSRVAEAVRSLDWGDRVVCVRVNGWHGADTHRDVAEVVAAAGGRLDAVMLPKVCRAEEVVALELLLDQVEREVGLRHGHVGIEVLIETAPALADVQRICVASPRLEAVALGPADLAASLGIPTLTIGAAPDGGGPDPYDYVLGAILVAARANRLQAVDGPCASLDDDGALRAASERARRLGYDGKWAIHPDQVGIVNDVFSPTAEELERALEIVRVLDAEAAGPGRGAARSGGEMVDEASRQLAMRTIERARSGRTGMARPAVGQ